MKNIVANEFLSLAGALLDHFDTASAIDCALLALRLEPESEATRKVIQRALETPRFPAAASPELQHLRARKRQVENLLRRDPGLCNCLGWEPLRLVQEPSPQPAPDSKDGELNLLLHRLNITKRRLVDMNDKGLIVVSRRLRALARHIARGKNLAGGPKSDPEAPDEAFFSEQSIEHQLHNIGNDFYRLGHFDKASECYNMAIEISPDLLETFFNRGLCYTRQGAYDKAHQDFSKVIELNPNLAEAHYTRGLVEEYRRDYAAAIKNYERALGIDPQYAKASSQIDIARRKQQQSANDTEAKFSTSGSGTATDKEGRMLDFKRYLVTSNQRFSDVCNLEAKARLEMIGAFLAGHHAFAEWGSEAPRGVLLYGPPGTGKTLLARALAGETQRPFYCTPSTVFLNMWYGNTESNLRAFWEEASAHPDGSIIFLDEFDAIGCKRTRSFDTDGSNCHDKAVGCLLELMDGMTQRQGRLVVLAASNCIENIDPAFLRPGRFDYLIHVPLPGEGEIAEILRIHLRQAETRCSRVQFLDPVLSGWVRNGAWKPGAADQLAPPLICSISNQASRNALSGADVAEMVRRCVDARTQAAICSGQDLGPIGAEDLLDHLEKIIAEKRAVGARARLGVQLPRLPLLN
jgi:tetratricopeptide (TPR) repeat protein